MTYFRTLAHPSTETDELRQKATALASLTDYEGSDPDVRTNQRELAWSDYFDTNDVAVPITASEAEAAIHEAVAAVPGRLTDWLAPELDGTDSDTRRYAAEITSWILDCDGDAAAEADVLATLELIRSFDRANLRNRAEWWADVNGFPGISVVHGDGVIAVAVDTGGAGALQEARVGFSWVLEGFPSLSATVVVLEAAGGFQEAYLIS